MMDIDIHDMDKAAVLAALFNASRPQGLGFNHYQERDMTVEQAQALIVEEGLQFDYLNGRVMKIDLRGDTFEARWYDRDNGEGAAFTAIRALRETGRVSGGSITAIHEHGRAIAADEMVRQPIIDDAVLSANQLAKRYTS